MSRSNDDGWAGTALTLIFSAIFFAAMVWVALAQLRDCSKKTCPGADQRPVLIRGHCLCEVVPVEDQR